MQTKKYEHHHDLRLQEQVVTLIKKKSKTEKEFETK